MSCNAEEKRRYHTKKSRNDDTQPIVPNHYEEKSDAGTVKMYNHSKHFKSTPLRGGTPKHTPKNPGPTKNKILIEPKSPDNHPVQTEKRVLLRRPQSLNDEKSKKTVGAIATANSHSLFAPIHMAKKVSITSPRLTIDESQSTPIDNQLKPEAFLRCKEEVDKSILHVLGAKPRTNEEIEKIHKSLSLEKSRKVRKKHFSTLKKKVLQERLMQWKVKQNELTPHEKSDIASSNTIVIWDYATNEELNDEDEMEEIISNLRDMALKIGDLSDLYVEPNTGNAYCRFATSDLAQAAIACWNNLVLGGNQLRVEQLTSESLNEASSVNWRSYVQSFAGTETPETNRVTSIVLDNVLTPDDFEDPDCLQESLDDIRTMANKVGNLTDLCIHNENQILLKYHGNNTALKYFHGKLISGQVVSASQMEDTISSVLLQNCFTADDLSDAECLEESLRDFKNIAAEYGVVKDVYISNDAKKTVVIDFLGNSAQTAALYLNGRVIGGQTIGAKVLKKESIKANVTFALWNVLTEDDFEDEECLDETKADIAELAKQLGSLVRVWVDMNSKSIMLTYEEEEGIAPAVLTKFNGMVIGGQSISACFVTDSKNPSTKIQDQEEVLTSVRNGLQPKLCLGSKIIPEKFAAMKNVPKIPNSGVARSYAIVTNDEKVKSLISEMIGELLRLQKRAILEGNSKAKRRLIMGLREVTRGLQSGKLKLVLMANNLDEYGVLDEKLREIMDLAKEKMVPIFYEYNKKSLGKLMGKNIKIAVIGVQNADGANQECKKLLSLATKHGLI
jgi:ribosomal protein L7Ae-like RNA K-turn-binding protein